LVSALEWFIEQHDAAAAVYLFLDVGRLWLMREPFRDGRAFAETLVALDGAAELDDFALLLTFASEFPRWVGDHAAARSLLERAIALFRARDQQKNLAHALHAFANVAALQRDLSAARAANEEGLALGREIRDSISIGYSLNSLGFLAFFEGAYDRMRDVAFEEVAIFRETGNLNALGAALHNLAEARRRLGEIDASVDHYQESMHMADALGDRGFVAECLDGLADVSAERGDLLDAVTLWSAAIRVFKQHGSEQWDPEEQRRGLAAAREALGPQAYDVAWERGQSMSEADMLRMGMSVRTKVA
ncbi:MAG: tetratricopeptide repeat protein, partial [Chloroflexota bacterium]|nr:tetratricopeptide repeat protein [Chloroflexota bacterium]